MTINFFSNANKPIIFFLSFQDAEIIFFLYKQPLYSMHYYVMFTHPINFLSGAVQLAWVCIAVFHPAIYIKLVTGKQAPR